MIVFNSDLDNTLIYSYKHELGEAKQCVELYQGREISFMTTRCLSLLEAIAERLLFVPTTTRSVEQYRRIRLGSIKPEYALVCNGGVLLHHGEPDAVWYQQSRQLMQSAEMVLKHAVELLDADPDRSFEVRFIEDLFVFTKSNEPQQTSERLKTQLDLSQVDVFLNGVKVYVLPKQLNKGIAIERFKERFAVQMNIAAGDSEFDIPMLWAADRSFCPVGLIRSEGGSIRQLEKSQFTLQMLAEIKKELDKNGLLQ